MESNHIILAYDALVCLLIQTVIYYCVSDTRTRASGKLQSSQGLCNEFNTEDIVIKRDYRRGHCDQRNEHYLYHNAFCTFPQ